VRLAASSDDAEQAASGSVSLTSADLELVFDAGGNQAVGLRFNGLSIPQGATILNAYVQFKVDETPSGPTALTIQGQAADNAPTFVSASGNISSRPRTTATVAWSPAPWPAVGAAGPDQRTPDITPVIQEIVSRPGWLAGNSLVILITGTGERVAESFDGDVAGAPLLYVEHTLSDNHRPTVDAGADQTITLPASATLHGTVTDDGLPNPPGAVTTTWSQVSGPGPVTFGNPNAVVTTASFSTLGTYVLRLTANDSQWVATDNVTITVLRPRSTTTTEVRVAASSDDAEQTSTGVMQLISVDLDLRSRTVGTRFILSIPQGATISNAYIQFQADEANSMSTTVTIQGEASDNAPTFTMTSGDITSRARTAASVAWSPAPWTTVGEVGPAQQTPDISSIIQEIVNRPGWTSGNGLVIFIAGIIGSGGARAAESFEGLPAGAAPLLHVEFSTP
jgi:hypothetical protein